MFSFVFLASNMQNLMEESRICEPLLYNKSHSDH